MALGPRNAEFSNSYTVVADRTPIDSLLVGGLLGSLSSESDFEEYVLSLTIAEYRELIGGDDAADIDWSYLDDPNFIELIDQATYEALVSMRDDSAFQSNLQSALDQLDQYPDDTLMSDVENLSAPGPITDDDFRAIVDQSEEYLFLNGWQIDSSPEGVVIESPLFRFASDGSWEQVDGGLDGSSGSSTSTFIDTIAPIIGDSVLTIMRQTPGFLGELLELGGTVSDVGEAWEIGTRTGEAYGEVYINGIEAFYDGRMTAEELDAQAQGAARQLIADLIGRFGAVGELLRGIIIGTRNSDVSVVVGSSSSAVSGSSHGDRFILGSDDDQFSGGLGRDVLFGVSGNDRLNGGAGRDLLFGGSNRDVLSGGSQVDRLFGGDGADRLFGGGKADVLSGGRGSDTLTGGQGADVFEFSKGLDIIADFRDGIDKIRLGGSLDFSDVNETSVSGGLKLTIDDQPGFSLIVLGASPAQVNSADFI